ncbi:HEAT repeat domain-containing protein [Aquipuribacter sp. SD81]|uniref:HEAT repeat domain-containing protein n=1 Tax=Aquipuribacter sp. SD81 TaxID=3127703 RepID=UPI00301735CA
MTSTRTTLAGALEAPDASVRLAAALRAGAVPDPALVGVLVARCELEPDFFVRDMLTWALTRHRSDQVVDAVLPELASPDSRARSQAVRTLSKVADLRTWPAVLALLDDPDDDVARAAWRTAVRLVPAGREAGLAEELTRRLGRGDDDVRLSLSRALVGLGEAAEEPLARALGHPDEAVRTHAVATRHLARQPDAGYECALATARRAVVLHGAPLVDGA